MVPTPKGPRHPDVARCFDTPAQFDNAQDEYPGAESPVKRVVAMDLPMAMQTLIYISAASRSFSIGITIFCHIDTSH